MMIELLLFPPFYLEENLSSVIFVNVSGIIYVYILTDSIK